MSPKASDDGAPSARDGAHANARGARRAAEAASAAPIDVEDVALGAYARARGDDASPGVVLVHDVWGLRDHPRDLARRLAAEGFRVLAVDLYRRVEPVAIADPGPWMQELSDPQVLADLEAGARFLRERARDGGAARVGVVGFCMGGMYALLAACGAEGFDASVPFYGLLSHAHGVLHREGGLDPARKPHEPLAVAHALRCPMLAFFGADDALVPLADVRALERALARAGRPSEVVVVEGAGHAFMNDTRPEAFRPEAAARAWTRTVAFLREQLGGA
ncbi:MAG: dienelactone hydrolase family protein [Myxococcota bacterium]